MYAWIDSMPFSAAPVTHANFRPNILVEGEDVPPFDEDYWTHLRIGDVKMTVVKHCQR